MHEAGLRLALAFGVGSVLACQTPDTVCVHSITAAFCCLSCNCSTVVERSAVSLQFIGGFFQLVAGWLIGPQQLVTQPGGQPGPV